MDNSFTWEPWNKNLPNEGGGVYLIVFKGTPKRVMYVGQTKNFKNRLSQHREGFLNGRRNIWRVETDQDIYELMSHNGEREPYKYYASLAKRGLLWATADRNKEKISNDLYPSDNFDENWRLFVREKYFVNFEVWVCRTDDDAVLRKRMESQIQNAIRAHYGIGSHIHHHVDDMCFLGKVEEPDQDFDTPYTFLNAPDVSDEFAQLLNNQMPENATRYLKPAKAKKQAEITAKKAVEAEVVRAARVMYKNAGKSWKLKDEADLRLCLNTSTPLHEIANRLSRTPEEIEKKYQRWVNTSLKVPELRYD